MTNHRNEGHQPGDVVFDESMILTHEQAQAVAESAVRDFPFPSEPEIKNCELTYPGRVDIPAGKLLGPGIDRRYASVQGCSYDAKDNKTTVFVEARTPLETVVDESSVFGFAQVVAASYNASVVACREAAAVTA